LSKKFTKEFWGGKCLVEVFGKNVGKGRFPFGAESYMLISVTSKY